MNNADKFKSAFGLYATEVWAMSEKEFLEWLKKEDDVPDRKVGKWKHDADGLVWCYGCGFGKERSDARPYNYCPNCGAKMDDDWEEPEINPCRGCDDYDGRGGCKSHGGCGAERSE